jgi:hypothetical protein
MSDQQLREAQRRWRASGCVEDEAEYLCLLLRVGRLPIERLRLAAALRHPPSEQVVGPTELAHLGELLSACGPEVCARAGAALARASMPVWTERFAREEQPEEDQDHRPENALRALETWILAPGDDTLDAALVAVDELHGSVNDGLAAVDHAGDEVQAPLSVASCLIAVGRCLTRVLRADNYPRTVTLIPEHLEVSAGIAALEQEHERVRPFQEAMEIVENGAQALSLRLGPNPLVGARMDIPSGMARACEILARDLVPWLLGRAT